MKKRRGTERITGNEMALLLLFHSHCQPSQLILMLKKTKPRLKGAFKNILFITLLKGKRDFFFFGNYLCVYTKCIFKKKKKRQHRAREENSRKTENVKTR